MNIVNTLIRDSIVHLVSPGSLIFMLVENCSRKLKSLIYLKRKVQIVFFDSNFLTLQIYRFLIVSKFWRTLVF